MSTLQKLCANKISADLKHLVKTLRSTWNSEYAGAINHDKNAICVRLDYPTQILVNIIRHNRSNELVCDRVSQNVLHHGPAMAWQLTGLTGCHSAEKSAVLELGRVEPEACRQLCRWRLRLQIVHHAIQQDRLRLVQRTSLYVTHCEVTWQHCESTWPWPLDLVSQWQWTVLHWKAKRVCSANAAGVILCLRHWCRGSLLFFCDQRILFLFPFSFFWLSLASTSSKSASSSASRYDICGNWISGNFDFTFLLKSISAGAIPVIECGVVLNMPLRTSVFLTTNLSFED